ncbi:MAG: multiheme c-type cytochrome, partial [Candidatus Binatia bacterium]
MTDEEVVGDSDKAHEKIFLGARFPSATECAPCHPKHYREWSISSHSYAQMSPIFNAMQAKILKLTNGTNGDFCIRCHTQVGMNLEEPEFMSNIDRHPTSREGISCVVCHRVNQAYGKLSGRLALVEGPITDQIYGPRGDSTELKKVIDEGGLVTDPDSPGRKIHGDLEKFFAITTSGFCGSCHDVTLRNGFRLEEAFSEYKSAPARRTGVSCHDCHMGKEQGRILADRTDPDFERKNYEFGSAAKVGSIETAPRKLTNHIFSGPDYSVLSPALYPLNPRAIKEESQKDDPTAPGLATIREWLK